MAPAVQELIDRPPIEAMAKLHRQRPGVVTRHLDDGVRRRQHADRGGHHAVERGSPELEVHRQKDVGCIDDDELLVAQRRIPRQRFVDVRHGRLHRRHREGAHWEGEGGEDGVDDDRRHHDRCAPAVRRRRRHVMAPFDHETEGSDAHEQQQPIGRKGRADGDRRQQRAEGPEPAGWTLAQQVPTHERQPRHDNRPHAARYH